MIKAGIPGASKKVHYPKDEDDPTMFEVEGLDGLLYQEIIQSYAQAARAGAKTTSSGLLSIETVRYGLKGMENAPFEYKNERVIKFGKEYWVTSYETLRLISESNPHMFDWLGKEILTLSMVSDDEKKASALPSAS